MLHQSVLAINLLCWAALAIGIGLRKRPPRAREVRRGTNWAMGLWLQSAGLALFWIFHRPFGGPMNPALAALAILLSAASVAVMIACGHALGKQFAYEARLVEDHRLVTTGPYRFVRHPIYLAFFTLSVSTGLAWGQWIVFVPFLVLFSIGTLIRVRAEERLLREAFGAEFDEWTRRVPALIPGIW